MEASPMLFYRLGAALLFGLLIGMEREQAAQDQALPTGVRTFALLGLLGGLMAMTAELTGGVWTFSILWAAVGLLIVAAYMVNARQGDVGLTTEVAALVTVGVGALCYWGQVTVAGAVSVVTLMLLSMKPELHTFVARLTREDLYAVLKFAVVTLVILPILPRTGYGPPPFDVLVPYRIWLMVVLISGISFLGYALMKVLGPERGIGITGLVGGLVSSTAVTLSFTQRSRREPLLAHAFAVAIVGAWSVMFARVLIEVAVVYAPLLRMVSIPLGVSMAAGVGATLLLYLRNRNVKPQEVSFSNPFELGPAIQFGLLYALILFVSKAAHMYLGSTGLYASGVLAGIADVDAITISMAELARTGQISALDATRTIVLATASNTTVKAAIVFTTGAPRLRRVFAPIFGVLIVVLLGVAFLVT